MADVSQPTFLQLPETIRRQIYFAAGVFVNKDIALNRHWWDTTSLGARYRRPKRESVQTARALLLTSRLISSEITSILFSGNRVVVHLDESDQSPSMLSLRPETIEQVSEMFIYRSFRVYCRHDDHYTRASTNLEPFMRLLPEALAGEQVTLQGWLQTAAHLAKYLISRRTSIWFSFDTSTLDVARQVAAPFFSFPVLRSCSIRLAAKPDPHIRKLARAASRAAQGKDTASIAHFPFLRLPYELRQAVLGLTDLIVPRKEVVWCPQENFTLFRYVGTCDGQLLWSPSCNPSEYHHLMSSTAYKGCFCSLFHAVSTPPCVCWHPPTALFLINRAIYREACSVFFGQNRIIVKPRHTPSRTTEDCFHLAKFWSRRTYADTLGALREIDFILPQIMLQDFECPAEQLAAWAKAIARSRRSLHTSRLTLRIYLPDHPYVENVISPICSVSDIGSSERVELLSHYTAILSPLSQLDNLFRLFIFIRHMQCWPAKRLDQTVDVADDGGWIISPPEPAIYGEGVQAYTPIVERSLERLVMGEKYDSTAMGKTEHKDSKLVSEVDSWPALLLSI